VIERIPVGREAAGDADLSFKGQDLDRSQRNSIYRSDSADQEGRGEFRVSPIVGTGRSEPTANREPPVL